MLCAEKKLQTHEFLVGSESCPLLLPLECAMSLAEFAFTAFVFGHPSASLFEVPLQKFGRKPIMFVRSGIYKDRTPVVQVVAVHNFVS